MVQGSQAKKNAQSITSIWGTNLLDKYGKVGVGQTVQPRNTHIAPFIPEKLKSTLETQETCFIRH